MPNTLDYDPRRPSNRRLFLTGVCCIAVAMLIVTAAIAKSKGKLTDLVRVTADLVDVGDGLPARSDVKFRGVLVGSVSDVVAAQVGRPNVVHIDLKPEFVTTIPNSVSARVVPSNVFAVSSVELIDSGRGTGQLRAGAVIPEDKSLPTLVFQTALNRARELFRIVGRSPTEDSVGALTALGEATQGRGPKITAAGKDVNDIVAQMNSIVGTENEPTATSALIQATEGLQTVAPDLFDALGSAVKPMQTFAEKRMQLDSFLSAGQGMLGTLGEAFDNQTDRLIGITTGLSPAIGVLADRADDFPNLVTKAQQVGNNFYDVGWNTETNTFLVKAVVSFTPGRTYVRADCPRYGELAGPSCATAPEIPTAPALLPALNSMGYPAPPYVQENRPNLAPPRGSVVGAPAEIPSPAEVPAPPGDTPPPSPPMLPAEVQPQAAGYGGTVGPVGSSYEKSQLSLIVGEDANAATTLLLGPLARGADVTIERDSGGVG